MKKPKISSTYFLARLDITNNFIKSTKLMDYLFMFSYKITFI